MSELTIKILQFVMSLSLLVVLHELGHFIPARLFKTRVEKFYLFFDPWFSLFKFKKGDTEYGIGWLPLGGYVKISGMVDESMDTEQLKSEPKPWEFRAKPAWQRLIIMIGGVVVNVILAFVIYAMMLFTWGKSYIPNENLTFGVYADSLIQSYGVENGDRIVSIGDITPKTLSIVNQEILFGDARDLVVERDGRQIQVTLPDDIDQLILASGKESILSEAYPAQVDSIVKGLSADKAGLVEGDKFVSLDDRDVSIYQALITSLYEKKGQSVDLVVERNGQPVEVTAQVDSLGKLGFYNVDPRQYFDIATQEFGFLESFPAGVNEGVNIMVSYVRSLKLVFSSEGVKKIGGFGTLTKLFPTTWDWQRFWNMTAFLSIILAVMNILPIPALDGGHVMFLLYEMITGREPGQKFLEYAQLAGIAILLTLMLYANGMDVYRWFTGQ